MFTDTSGKSSAAFVNNQLKLIFDLIILRLTIPMALMILYIVGLEYQLGSGPFWTDDISMPSNRKSRFRHYFLFPMKFSALVKNCEMNWWSNLLYINNFVGPNNQCLAQAWYLACDMQFYWYSPLLLIPMFKYQKGNRWGLKWWLLNLVVFTVVPIALTVKYNLPPTTTIL